MTTEPQVPTGPGDSRRTVLARYAAADAAGRDDVLDGVARAAASGSPAATELLVELAHTHRVALPAITSVLTDPADIDDAAQLTLIAIYERITSFADRAHVRSWIKAIARNEALMVLRRKRRKTEPSGEEVPDVHGFVRRLSSVVADESIVNEAVATLDERFRVALLLREMDGLEYDEIAARLDVPIGTVRSRIARARAQLARQAWRVANAPRADGAAPPGTRRPPGASP